MIFCHLKSDAEKNLQKWSLYEHFYMKIFLKTEDSFSLMTKYDTDILLHIW